MNDLLQEKLFLEKETDLLKLSSESLTFNRCIPYITDYILGCLTELNHLKET